MPDIRICQIEYIYSDPLFLCSLVYASGNLERKEQRMFHIEVLQSLQHCQPLSVPASGLLVKLLESKEANHIEFCRIKHVVDEVVQMYKNVQLFPILQLLLDPTWTATGLQLESEILVNECELISKRIQEMISVDGETDQCISSSEFIPIDFFEDMESSWRGRVKRVHAEEVFAEVERAAEALTNAVIEDFVPIVSRINSIVSSFGGPRGEISYSREHEAVWFKGKRFVPTVWAGTPGEGQIKQLKHAMDSKGRKVGDEWFTTCKVDDALNRYHEANALAKVKVMEILRGLSVELQAKINILVFSSTLLIIAKALFAHVSEGRRRTWVFPQLIEFHISKDREILDVSRKMDLIGLSPYWFDIAEGGAIKNTISMQSLFLLTGPNGGGKSSLLRSICAASLLGICGLMVPAESALIPHFDSVMLHMKSYDSPADGKSSFQIEMSELRSLVNGASPRSLVLIDEICRGTETIKGTCIAGSIVEALDGIGCLGIISTHLHGIFDLSLSIKNVVYKAMGTEMVHGRVTPTWKVRDGICRESLAFETAQREGIPEAIIRRAGELFLSIERKAANFPEMTDRSTDFIVDPPQHSRKVGISSKAEHFPSGTKILSYTKTLHEEVEKAVVAICQKMVDLHKKKITSSVSEVTCVSIGAREQPPPSTIGTSSVYVMFRPDKKLYIGQTDDLAGRVRTHRMEEGLQNSSFLYALVPGKSVASELETLLINQLPLLGFRLVNRADGKHRNFGTSNLSVEALSLHQ